MVAAVVVVERAALKIFVAIFLARVRSPSNLPFTLIAVLLPPPPIIIIIIITTTTTTSSSSL
jgi:hypothetical protein